MNGDEGMSMPSIRYNKAPDSNLISKVIFNS
jgi:hypothetical protein